MVEEKKIIFNLPNGTVLKFEEGTPKDIIDKVIAENSPKTPSQRVAGAFEAVTPEPGLRERAIAGISGAIEGTPIIGPALLDTGLDASAKIRSMGSGLPFEEERENVEGLVRFNQGRLPGTTLAGNIGGAIAGTAPVAGTKIGAHLLGMTGKTLPGRMTRSGVSGGAISAADTAARGGDVDDIVGSTAIGTGLGSAIPGAGAALSAVTRPVANKISSLWGSVFNPAGEAQKRVGGAVIADQTNPSMLTPADEAAAALNQQPLLNVDRGGETTRALAKAVANTDPAARGALVRTASDRFASQGPRAMNFVRRITGGRTDDLVYRDNILNSARKANKPMYDRAYASPGAADMWDDTLKQLMVSPSMQKAARAVKGSSSERVARTGGAPIDSPFVTKDGIVTLSDPKTMPNLEFWDNVQRNLRKQAEAAGKQSKSMAAELWGLHRDLVNHIDAIVPEFKSARQGAAGFFGAEDALEAGKKFLNQNRTIPETEAALKKFTDIERDAFGVGFASELLDKIRATGDRQNVSKSIFGSQAARDKIRLAMGDDRFEDFQHFVNVENTMDMLRGVLGGSDTAKNLVEMGLVGAGTWAYTGDPVSGLVATAVARGAQGARSKVTERVTRQIADLLLSDDPRAMQQAVQLAKRSPQAQASLDAIQRVLGTLTRSQIPGAVMPDEEPTQRRAGPLDIGTITPEDARRAQMRGAVSPDVE